MGGSWLFRPLPLRERVGRGVAPVSSTLRTRRLVVPSPPHPNPLPRGEREPEVPSTKGVIATSTVLALAPCPSRCHRPGRRHSTLKTGRTPQPTSCHRGPRPFVPRPNTGSRVQRASGPVWGQKNFVGGGLFDLGLGRLIEHFEQLAGALASFLGGPSQRRHARGSYRPATTCNSRRATFRLTPSAWATLANSSCLSREISMACFSRSWRSWI